MSLRLPADRCLWRRLLAVCLALLSCHVPAGSWAQQAVPAPWQSEAQPLRRFESPADPSTAKRPTGSVPANGAGGQASRTASVSLSAYLTQDGEPIDQGLAIMKSTRNEQAARAFIAFLNSPQGKSTMKKYGF